MNCPPEKEQQQIRINQVVLVPHRGHSNNQGEYDRGHDAGFIAEVDILQAVTVELEREFEDWGIRWYSLDVFKRPGIKFEDRPARVEPHSLVLDLRCGWYKSPRSRNMSGIYFGHQASALLADRFHEALGEWGSCTNYGHRVGLPKLDPTQAIIGRPHVHGIRLDLFAMNGPDMAQYVKRLRELSRDIGSVVIDFLRGKDAPAGAGRGVYLK